MKKRVVLISEKSKELNQIDAVLSKNKYRVHLIEGVENLDKALADTSDRKSVV